MDISLQEIIEKKACNPRVIALMQHELIDVIIYSEKKVARLHPDTIMIAENFGEIYLNDKAYTGNPASEADLMQAYGDIMIKLLDTVPAPHRSLRRIAQKCSNRHYSSLSDLRLSLERRLSNTIYLPLIAILLLLMTILWALSTNA